METDFLVLNYGQIDILINRAQFISSLYLDRELAIKSPLKYFRSVTFFKEECLLLFDMHACLHRLFACSAAQTARLILIMDLGTFSPAHRELLTRLSLRGQQSRFTPAYLALKVSSQAEIVSVSLRELKPLPRRLRVRQEHLGILGVRFCGPQRVQYFIDSETFIINSLAKRKVEA